MARFDMPPTGTASRDASRPSAEPEKATDEQRIAELEARNGELQARNAALEERLNKMERSAIIDEKIGNYSSECQIL